MKITMQFIENIVNSTNALLWDNALVYLLCGIGLYYTFRLGFLQIRRFKISTNLLLGNLSLSGKNADKSGMSSFQALATAVAGQVGTGNLAGPATAIIAGGPGAIFWMWISSFLGMATIYAEAILAQQFKSVDKNGQAVGGPAYYIEQGLKAKWLAMLFAVLIIIALGLIGNMVQSNSIASAFSDSLGISQWVTGLLVAVAVMGVTIGGVGSIASFTAKIVPTMALFYLFGALLLLALNYNYILPAFNAIFVAAFNPEAVLGGGAGVAIQQAMRFGIARGLFSNEAGMGSTPHAHAVAKVKSPYEQGYIAMMGVFIVCLIVTLTGLVIISSALKLWHESGQLNPSFLSVYNGKGTGITVTQYAYESIFGRAGGIFIAISLLFFAFSTIIGWYYYAESNVRYLFSSTVAIRIFQCMVIISVFLASFFRVDLIWNMADLFNGLMILPNLAALLLLSPIVIRYTQHYVYQSEIKTKSVNSEQ